MAERKRRKIAVGSAVFLCVALLLTVVLLLFVAEPRVKRVLFFPGTVTRDLSGESRTLPRYESKEENIRTVVEEIILGPATISRSPALSQQTDIRLFMFRDAVVYVDLSAAVMINAGEVNLDVRESLNAVRRSISFNFPRVRDIVITISGQLPFEPLHVDTPDSQI